MMASHSGFKMNILNYLENNYFDFFSELKAGNFPANICLLYINPFNYFFFRNGPLYIDYSRYRVDGIFASSLIRFLVLKGRPVRRQSFDMTSLAPLVFSYCQDNGLSVFVAGGNDVECLEFKRKISIMFPQLILLSSISGYLSEDDIINAVVSSDCDVTILSLGNEKQERVALRLASIRPSRYFTCGAFVSQTARSENGYYYPGYIDKFNLRWLYRLVNESHIWRRVIKYYPRFLWQIIIDVYSGRRLFR